MLRDYQSELASQAAEILLRLYIVYLAFEMRVGKTLTALQTAHLVGAKNVLFLTKKKAIASIKKDYQNEGFSFSITITNYEQLHHLKPEFDLVIADEGHGLGKIGKPSQRIIETKRVVGNAMLIVLSGTPTPENFSMFFHQFWVSKYSPFPHRNFYSWAKDGYVNIRRRKVSQGMEINDYSDGVREKIMPVVGPYILYYTRKEAGFNLAGVEEEIVRIKADPRIHKLVRRLLRDRCYTMKDGSEIVCDTAVKLQNKVHQICSGTVIVEDGSARVLDMTKARYIAEHYKDMPIAIFYKFQAELAALKAVIPEMTTSPEEFNSGKYRVFVSQIQSGAMGIDLSKAAILVFYNIDFSAVNYWQARDRLLSMSRTEAPLVHWLFSCDGIEEKIYKAVAKKKDFTLYHFRKEMIIPFEKEVA